MKVVEEQKPIRMNRQTWIQAAFDALAETGIEGVRVEVLAKRMEVTKGGFYWHFRDRPELLDVVLETWKTGRIETITEHASSAGAGPRATLERLLEKYVGHTNPHGTAIELAIRNWAQRDDGAARAVAEVDAVRLSRVADLYREMGLNGTAAHARAYLFYSYVFGQSLLVVEGADPDLRATRKRCLQWLIDGDA